MPTFERYKHVLVICDALSNTTYLYPLRWKGFAAYIYWINMLLKTMGNPKLIAADANFSSEFIE